MQRRYFIIASVATCSLAMAALQLRAQSSAPAVDELRTVIGRGIGAERNTLEIRVSHNVLVVLRINSNMNAASHDARDNEAMAIASLASKAIAGKAEFKKLVAIRVEFVARPAAGGREKRVDMVEFREGPDGVFRHHRI
jgi:hypothetical protein